MWARKSSSERCASGETSVATISTSPLYQHHCRHAGTGGAARAQRPGAQEVHDADDQRRSQLQRRDLEGHVGDVSQTSDSLGSVPGMSDRTTPPFRADHVGSLLRPPVLLQAREDFANDRIDAGELRGIEDEAIRDVVQAAGGRRPAIGHRRRVPARVVAHGLHLSARRHLQVAGQPQRQVPQRRGRHRVHAGRDAHRRQGHAREADLRPGLRVPPERRDQAPRRS